MKKVLILLLTAAMIITLCACASNPAPEQQTAPAPEPAATEAPEAEAPSEPAPAETAPAPEAPTEEPAAETVPQALGADQDQQGVAAAINSAAGNITEEAAKQVALTDAGVKDESAVTNMRVKQDRDDGRQVYEVEFIYDDVRYNYDIDAATGGITEASGEFRGSLPAGSGDVGEDAAVDAALAHAGIMRDKATGLYVKTDYENGRLIYEIEFFFNAFEYDYDVDAATGVITEWERSL